MSALSRAVASLSKTLNRVAGEAATLTRGPATSVSVTAVHDLQSYEVMNDQGFPETVIAHDFLVASSQLAGLTGGPRSGDRINIAIAGAEAEFELLPVGSRPCFELADPDGVMIVLHTKKVA